MIASTPAVDGVVVVGASTGGTEALRSLLGSLPGEFPLPVVIAQHLHDEFTGMLSHALRRHTRLQLDDAVTGDSLRRGVCLLAAGTDVTITGTGTVVVSPSDSDSSRSVDMLFESAADAFGGNVLAVVLSGMGEDGLRGSAVVRARGGRVLAQSEASSSVWGMPGAVTRAGLSSFVADPLGLALILSQVASDMPFRPACRPIQGTEEPS